MIGYAASAAADRSTGATSQKFETYVPGSTAPLRFRRSTRWMSDKGHIQRASGMMTAGFTDRNNPLYSSYPRRAGARVERADMLMAASTQIKRSNGHEWPPPGVEARSPTTAEGQLDELFDMGPKQATEADLGTTAANGSRAWRDLSHSSLVEAGVLRTAVQGMSQYANLDHRTLDTAARLVRGPSDTSQGARHDGTPSATRASAVTSLLEAQSATDAALSQKDAAEAEVLDASLALHASQQDIAEQTQALLAMRSRVAQAESDQVGAQENVTDGERSLEDARGRLERAETRVALAESALEAASARLLALDQQVGAMSDIATVLGLDPDVVANRRRDEPRTARSESYRQLVDAEAAHRRVSNTVMQLQSEYVAKRLDREERRQLDASSADERASARLANQLAMEELQQLSGHQAPQTFVSTEAESMRAFAAAYTSEASGTAEASSAGTRATATVTRGLPATRAGAEGGGYVDDFHNIRYGHPWTHPWPDGVMPGDLTEAMRQHSTKTESADFQRLLRDHERLLAGSASSAEDLSAVSHSINTLLDAVTRRAAEAVAREQSPGRSSLVANGSYTLRSFSAGSVGNAVAGYATALEQRDFRMLGEDLAKLEEKGATPTATHPVRRSMQDLALVMLKREAAARQFGPRSATVIRAHFRLIASTMETTDPIDLVHQAIRGHATLAEKTGLERLFKRDTGDASGDVQADQIVADVLERAVRHVNGPLESIVVTSAIRAAEHPSAVPLLPCTVPRHMTAADFGPNTVNAYEYHTAKTAYAELPQWAVLQAAIRAAPSELRVKCDDLLRAKARARGALSPEQAGELDIVADRILMLARPLVDARPDTSRGAAISAALEGGQTDVSSASSSAADDAEPTSSAASVGDGAESKTGAPSGAAAAGTRAAALARPHTTSAGPLSQRAHEQARAQQLKRLQDWAPRRSSLGGAEDPLRLGLERMREAYADAGGEDANPSAAFTVTSGARDDSVSASSITGTDSRRSMTLGSSSDLDSRRQDVSSGYTLPTLSATSSDNLPLGSSRLWAHDSTLISLKQELTEAINSSGLDELSARRLTESLAADDLITESLATDEKGDLLPDLAADAADKFEGAAQCARFALTAARAAFSAVRRARVSATQGTIFHGWRLSRIQAMQEERDLGAKLSEAETAAQTAKAELEEAESKMPDLIAAATIADAAADEARCAMAQQTAVMLEAANSKDAILQRYEMIREEAAVAKEAFDDARLVLIDAMSAAKGGGPSMTPNTPGWGAGMTPGAASAWSPMPHAPTRSGGESKVDPEADRRASYGATNHASFADARMSQPPGGPPMPPPGGGGSHDAMFGPDHLPRSVSEIGMMDYGTLGMKYGTVDHTTVDYWVWSGCPMWEAVHPYAAHVLVTKMSDRLWQRLMLYLNGARRDLVRLVARGDGLALWWELCKAFEVRNEYVADRLRERILDFRLGVGSRQNWELLTEGVERLRSLIELHRRASPIVYGYPYKIPIDKSFWPRFWEKRLPDRYKKVQDQIRAIERDRSRGTEARGHFPALPARPGYRMPYKEAFKIIAQHEAYMASLSRDHRDYDDRFRRPSKDQRRRSVQANSVTGADGVISVAYAVHDEDIPPGALEADLFDSDSDPELPDASNNGGAAAANPPPRADGPRPPKPPQRKVHTDKCPKCGKGYNPTFVDMDAHGTCFKEGTGPNDLCHMHKKIGEHSKARHLNCRCLRQNPQLKGELEKVLNLGGQAQQAQQGTKFRKPKPDKSRKPKPDKPRKPAGGPNANNADPGRSRRGPGQSRVQPGQSSISLAVDTVSRLEGRCIKCGSKAHFVKACDASNAQCTKWTTVDGPAAFKKMFAFKAVADSGAAGQTSQQQGGSAGAVEQDMSTVTGQAAALQDALSSLSVSQAPPPDPELSPRTPPPSPPPSPPSRENVDPDDCADAPERSESTKPADARLNASGRGESTGFAHAAHVGEGGQSSEPTDPDAPDRDGPIEMEESVCNHWAEGVMMSLEAWAAGASPADLQQLLAPTTPKFPRVEVMIPDPQPRAVECGCWTVRMDAPISMGEAFEHRRQLYLYVNQDNEDSNDPVNQKWHTGSTAHLGALPNTARVRLPTGPRWGSAMDVSETAYDLAQAYARMQTGEFDVLVIPQSLQSLERGHTRVKELLDSLVADRTSDEGPEFTRSYDHDELVREHHARLQTPRRAISFLSVMCGVSGEGLAVQACGADPDKMTFLEICPLNCQILRRRYPRAVIINGDVRDPTAQALVVKYAGNVDMMMVAELCQPSSLASKTHDPNDERLATGIAAVQLVALVSPASLVVENVASFKSKQAATFHKVVALIGKHFDQVIIMHSNANECMTCTKRARVWMMGCASEVDLGPMRDFCGRQKRMRVEGALKTAPSVRAELPQHRPDVAGKLGVAIPHLRVAREGWTPSPHHRHRRRIRDHHHQVCGGAERQVAAPLQGVRIGLRTAGAVHLPEHAAVWCTPGLQHHLPLEPRGTLPLRGVHRKRGANQGTACRHPDRQRDSTSSSLRVGQALRTSPRSPLGRERERRGEHLREGHCAHLRHGVSLGGGHLTRRVQGRGWRAPPGFANRPRLGGSQTADLPTRFRRTALPARGVHSRRLETTTEVSSCVASDASRPCQEARERPPDA